MSEGGSGQFAGRGHERNGPGMPPVVGESYASTLGAVRPCPICAMAVPASAYWCPNCGAEFFSPRSKRTAVVLAVFLTFWTWYYTYRQDKKKFWAGLGLSTLALFLSHAGIGYVVLTCVWIWAVVDAAVKPARWYRRYPSRQR